MDLQALQAHMPDGWAIVPQVNGVETIMDCMADQMPKRLQERRRAAFTVHACYKRIEELEQQAKGLQEALDDKARVTREISDLIDPVAEGGATTPALIDVQAQLQRDLPNLVSLLRQAKPRHLDHPVADDLLYRYAHLIRPKG
jgi:predicted transcriptional regulator